MKTALLLAVLGFGVLCGGLVPPSVAQVPKAQVAVAPTVEEAIEAIASLADPAKLATLGERGGNTRVQKITYWLFIARQRGAKPEAVIDAAFAKFGWKGTPAGEETKLTMMRNLSRGDHLNCFTPEGLALMRRGSSAIVRRGEFYGDKMSVDHILPRAEAPGLDNVLANLELMPQRMNSNKSAKIADREKHIARRFVAAGLVSPEVVPWAAPFPSQPTSPAIPATTPIPARPAASTPAPTPAALYFASEKSAVFHQQACKSVAKISAGNLKSYPSREEAIRDGKKPCTICKP